jgi:cyclophilin family peptidyl-prolyl cis-trans isomerase
MKTVLVSTGLLAVMILASFSIFACGCKENKEEQSENVKIEKKQAEQVTGNEKTETKGGNPMVIMYTSMGDIKIELYPDKAPITVKNFLSYVNDGFYDGTVFHRVIPGFMIQGGGFTPDMEQKPTKPPIKNEADNGLRNEAGTIAMARTNVVDSATSQFFINQVDNDFLNHSPQNFGYAVFGRVIEGMDVVNRIANVRTGVYGPFQDVPIEPVVIKSVRLVESKGK